MRVETFGDCTLYLGDGREVIALAEADVVVTDPPYGIGFEYASYDDTECNLDALLSELIRPAIEKCGRAIITPGNTNLHKYPMPAWTGAWTWDTTTARGFYGWSQWQPILIYGADPASGFGHHNGFLRSDRIHFSGGQADIVKADGGCHTCPKPVTFMKRLVGRFSNEGETVFDPLMGSGTTGVACVNLGRKFIGAEIEEAYFDIACRRIEQACSQPRLFDEPRVKPSHAGDFFKGEAA